MHTQIQWRVYSNYILNLNIKQNKTGKKLLDLLITEGFALNIYGKSS